jgi:hypothetical protein
MTHELVDNVSETPCVELMRSVVGLSCTEKVADVWSDQTLSMKPPKKDTCVETQQLSEEEAFISDEDSS